MSTKVNINENNINTSRNFENNIAKTINGKLAEHNESPVGIIEVNSVDMSSEGRGQYKQRMELTIDDREYTIIMHSTDSQLYDNLGDHEAISPTTYNNLYKRFALSLLASKVDRLVDEIFENRDNNNQ